VVIKDMTGGNVREVPVVGIRARIMISPTPVSNPAITGIVIEDDDSGSSLLGAEADNIVTLSSQF
jgi:hypothetical protein